MELEAFHKTVLDSILVMNWRTCRPGVGRQTQLFTLLDVKGKGAANRTTVYCQLVMVQEKDVDFLMVWIVSAMFRNPI